MKRNVLTWMRNLAECDGSGGTPFQSGKDDEEVIGLFGCLDLLSISGCRSAMIKRLKLINLLNNIRHICYSYD